MQTIRSDEFTTKTAAAAVAAMAATASVHAAGKAPAVDELLTKIRSTDDAVRGPAWQRAAPYGAAAVKPLAEIMSDASFEIARSAKRALWVIVRHAGRPGAGREAQAVAREVIALLPAGSAAVRREALWMLSEIGSDDSIPAVSALLSDKDVRADALAALMRLPGRKSTAAIKTAFSSAPEEFKFALADALRRRGEKVSGYPSQKLVPTKKTTVTHQPPAATG